MNPPALNPAPGELTMPGAPTVTLSNGCACVPQHYLQFRHDARSVQSLLAEVACDAHSLLFAAEDGGGVYVQVGLIGRENYERGAGARPLKLVYGRKWRIDPDTPSSEIVQTAFLALQKAHEHEVRELLTLRDATGVRVSTPLSNHLDLPLMAAFPELTAAEPEPQALDRPLAEAVREWLSLCQFAQRPLELLRCEDWGVDGAALWVRIGSPPAARAAEGELAHFDGQVLRLQLAQASRVELVFALMDALIHCSNRRIEEAFRFRGFARFSRRNDPARIAQLSRQLRPYARDLRRPEFAAEFQRRNYDTDASRAPRWPSGALARVNAEKLTPHRHLSGHLPQGYARAAA
ncbi:MAG: hypothetical protein U1E77_04665 [Inhella sp.]